MASRSIKWRCACANGLAMVFHGQALSLLAHPFPCMLQQQQIRSLCSLPQQLLLAGLCGPAATAGPCQLFPGECLMLHSFMCCEDAVWWQRQIVLRSTVSRVTSNQILHQCAGASCPGAANGTWAQVQAVSNTTQVAINGDRAGVVADDMHLLGGREPSGAGRISGCLNSLP